MLYSEYLNNRRDYQELGALFLLEKKHCCLFYKPGKGKTYPAVDALREVDKMKNGQAKVLILSTADAIKNMWNAEIVPQNILPQNTILMSLTAAIQDRTKMKLLKVNWDIIVVDECHKIKSHNAKSSKLVYSLSRKAEYTWGLSGTPRGNTDIDIFCQFHNMNVSGWGDITYTQFVNQCCDIDQRFFHGQKVVIPIGINKKYIAGWEKNVAMFSQRIGYDEEDNMPELQVQIVDFPYVATKEYLQAEQGVIQLSDYETTMTKLVAIQKLHQAVNGFLYLTDVAEDKRQIYHIERNKKLDWLKNNIDILHPVVIVYRFAADLKAIQKEFGQEYTTEIVDEFKQGNKPILLLQCSRCESFNLQMCNRIVFYTLDYSYIKYDQMLHRLWRIGQTKPVLVQVLLFKDTIETKIWNAIETKQSMSELFMSIKGE